ncbi:MAG: M3 family metallopeptidase [Nocardioides sp.]|uniref:M3 family metallopeptidase n=1 Tax=Nocardioides sp. TaxID=35761 RepID=UPI0039E2C347
MPLEPLSLPPAEEIREWIDARAAAGLARATEIADGLRAASPSGESDALAVLGAWNELETALSNIGGAASLLSSVHPDEATREACEGHLVAVQKLATSLNQDPALYAAFSGLPTDQTEGLDEVDARYLERVLRDFRRAGVDQPDEVRARVAELTERTTTLDIEFSRILRDDVRTIRVEPSRLDGLPADWIEAHPVGEDGLVAITTDYPDAFPLRTFATDRALRLEMVTTMQNKGYPTTEPVLRELFAKRHELATLLGYADWPSYDAEVKMIGDGGAIPEFIDKIAAASEEAMRRDVAVLFERLRADVPEAPELTAADTAFYSEVIRRERFDVDAQVVRRYFDFGKVRAGLLDVTGRLFGLSYAEVADAAVWHPDVTSYDVALVDGGERLGRIYLDLHPREGKYKHAAQFTLVDGVEGVQEPEGVLVCNFPRGLMEHDDVVTLFHEFGHLLHHLVGGHSRRQRFSGVATEWDFVEAPSQMLEEWAWDAVVLGSFATDAAGEPIPAELVEKMRAGEEFGKGIQARQQMFYAAISYWFHALRPDDLTATMVELQDRYAPTRWIEGTHFFADFGHLGGYSSAYYTYMWSLVIAKDLFSAFDPADLFDAEVAGRYRDLVLGRGGEKDAADLVADFLGRPFSFDSYAAWLSR